MCIRDSDNPLVDRSVARKLSDFFSRSLPPDAFAFIRVIETNQYVDKTNHYRPYYQESDVEVILTISVSYTHLDVYKRQMMYLPLL